MSSFKKLNTKIYQKSASVVTPDFIYWKQLSPPVLVKEFGPIDYIDFSPVEPYYFAVTCSVRVQVYNPVTKLVAKNLSRFRESAYGAVFRSDGRLICAGGEEASVKLFDVSTKSLLRLFKGHSAAIHRTFFIEGKPQIASFSDDKSVKIWDIPTETNVITYSDHTDYIRAGATNPAVPDVVLAGGYDNFIKMYDTRTNEMILNVNHGSPVESLLFLPSGSIFLSAGGTEIKIWDTVAGGKLLGSISQHHKTITCLRLASDNKRLLSGSLDRHVKIYDLSSYKAVHTLDYPNAILSMGVSKNDETVVVGLVDGLVAISRREDEKTEKVRKQISFQHKTNLHQPTVDVIIPQFNQEKETKYDKCLRKFEYSKALDCVLVSYVANKTPQVTVSVIQELIKRRALQKAFVGRDVKSLTQILRFFIRNITENRFAKVLIDAANIFIDTYEENPLILNPEVRNLLISLTHLLREEAEIANDMTELQGAMHMLLSAATIHTEARPEQNVHHNLLPSKEAQKNLIVNLT
ncbi:U3 small nucleolar RNA-associated protein 15 homolog [Tribolium madens]|uniref:U3 small nucleolar RNA-associated protein 15 homolog n=1 Tax=Tribolium madens TaxID=41895 RepID=UPI001CF761D7|nr:U3 small nucleolar RNA-associated protein 15 homolog [Tribolium madens]